MLTTRAKTAIITLALLSAPLQAEIVYQAAEKRGISIHHQTFAWTAIGDMIVEAALWI